MICKTIGQNVVECLHKFGGECIQIELHQIHVSDYATKSKNNLYAWPKLLPRRDHRKAH